MPRSNWLASHVSASHLPSLSRTSSSASVPHQPPTASTPNTPSSSTFAQNPASIPIPSTPWDDNHNAYFPQTPSTETGPYHGIHNIHGSSYLEIVLDSQDVILRGAGGDTNPANLSGRVVLHLAESTNVKEITLVLTGKAKVGFSDGTGSSTRSHAHTHLLIHHDWSFLTPAPSAPGKKPVPQNHTLKAGVHSFPFSLTLESDTTIPSSIRTWNNDAYVFYKLRAVAHRSGAFASNYQATKPVNIIRTFTAEALEFTQTLEIENSWPMKVAYSLTLPHKAFAAGDTIPIAVKFQPLAKGVHITSVSTVVKEYTLVHTKNSSHPDVRVAASIRHDIRNGRAYVHKDKSHEAPRPPPTPRHDAEDSPAPTPGASGSMTPASRRGSLHPVATPAGGSHAPAEGYFPAVPAASNGTVSQSPAEQAAINGNVDHGTLFPDGDPVLGGHEMDAQEAYLQSREESREVELGDGEIDTMISIPLPTWTTPSHAVHPVFVTHKIKWSCVISNPDGHTSELRCALPIHVLAPSLAEEARTASASTRALLFGLSGDAQAEVQQLELPSYSNHVFGRVANAAVNQASGSAVASPWSAASRNGSPSTTPPASRPGSRPSSPVLGMRSLSSALFSHSLSSHSSNHHGSGSGGSGGQPSSFVDDHHIPERPHLNWADSELLLSLGATGLGTGSNGSQAGSGPNSPHRTPPESRAPSRSGSFSRPGGFRMTSSRPPSRPASPEHGHRPGSASPAGPPSGYNPKADSGSMRNGESGGPSIHDRRGSAGLFHLPHSMKPFSSFGHKHGKSHGGSHHDSPLHSPSLLYPNHQPSIAPNGIGNGSNNTSTSASPIGSRNASAEDLAALSQVPSYNIASRGFLGGGVVPLSAVQGLPDYDESEQFQRAKSESNLPEVGRKATAGPSRLGADPSGGLDPNMSNSHASSSALASALSTTAEAGTLASPMDIPMRSRYNDEDEHDEDEMEDDDGALTISTGKKRAARSPSVSTLMPSNGNGR